MTPFIQTLKERCRVCYTCVRECPAKAIRIVDGQAEIMPERCICCGNCVRVCSQDAKQVVDTTGTVRALLDDDAPVAACVAPSFPAEFVGLDEGKLVAAVRALGFDYVHEVAFGADLVAAEYRRLLGSPNAGRHIATTCPAIASFVEKYHPDLVASLAPIVSPMVAIARVIRRTAPAGTRVVFIGPCIAKKHEADDALGGNDIDAVLTFAELRRMLDTDGICPAGLVPTPFDPPHGGLGAIFPVSRGLLQTADIPEDLLTGTVVAADGRSNFVEAIKEFADGDLDARLLEALACQGCIMGAGMSNAAPLFSRRAQVSRYVKAHLDGLDRDQWREDVERLAETDLTRRFSTDDQRIGDPSNDVLADIMERMGKFRPEDELNCGACGYETCHEHAVAIYKGLAESEMCLPYSIDELRRTVAELEVSNEQLASTQSALMQSEKLASMGQLAAGIAHEVNNPLGIVLMYAHLLLEDCAPDNPVRDDLQMIAEQANRCKKIVAGLLHFARQNKLVREPTDLAKLIDRGLAAIATPANVRVDIHHDVRDPQAEIDRDQILQVLTNLVTNAVDAMPEGGTLTLRTADTDDAVRLEVADTGSGIREEDRARIFDPFFTTKQIGRGTGLGLAVTYGIIKMHSGTITVESSADPGQGPTGTTFRVELPRRGSDQ